MPDLQASLAGSLSLRRGSRQVRADEIRGRQLRLVTAMLLLERRHPVSVDTLAGQLWREDLPTNWRVIVRNKVSQLRGHLVELGLTTESIMSTSGAYTVQVDRVVVDLEQATAWAQQARAALSEGDWQTASDKSSQARAILSRPVLVGIDSEWLDGVRDRLVERHLDVLVTLGQARSRLGHAVNARTALNEAVALAPTREDAWRALMRAELAAGNSAAALETYQRCRGVLAEELGVDPSAATQAVHREVLQLIPSAIDVATPDVAQASSTDSMAVDGAPYVGLRAFNQADADRFFGRDDQVQEVVGRLDRHRIVVLTGPSGIGKSSLLRAGLLPALERGAIPESDTWIDVLALPGATPLKSLASELSARFDRDTHEIHDLLAGPGGGLHVVADQLLADHPSSARLLVVIDQLEEAFTRAPHDEAATLVELAVNATRRLDGRVMVLAALRADHIDQATAIPGMAELLSRALYMVPPLAGEQVELAVTEPARRAGLVLEPGLLAEILTDVAGQPGALPLLQHLLFELWDHRVGTALTRRSYDDLGGVSGALTHRAEAVMQDLDAQQRRHARRLLLRGIQPSEDGADTRRPVRASEWAGSHDTTDPTGDVVARLVAARLLTAGHDPVAGEPTVELAHEALIDGWPRLRAWVGEARGWLLDHRRLTVAADDWESHGRHDDWLLSGLPLDEAHQLTLADARGDIDLHLSPHEHALVRDSLAARERDLAAEQARRDRETALERRSATRLRALVVLVLVGALASLGVAWRTSRSARVARAQHFVAEANDALDVDPELSVLLALEAHDQVGGITSVVQHDIATTLHAALADLRLARTLPGGEGRQVLALSHDGTRYVSDLVDPAAHEPLAVRSTETGDLLQTVTLPDARAAASAAFSPDDALLVVGGWDGVATVHEAVDGEVVQRLAPRTGDLVLDVVVDPEGRLVAGLWEDRLGDGGFVVHVFDVSSGRQVWTSERLRLIEEVQSRVFFEPPRVAFDPTGTRLGLAGDDRVTVVDTDSFAVVFTRERAAVTDLAWNPDGRWIAISDGRVTLLDAATGDPIQTLRGEAVMGQLAWSPDGDQLAVSSSESFRGDQQATFATVWPLGGDEPTLDVEPITLRARPRGNTVIAFSPDGRTLLEGSHVDGSLRAWRPAEQTGTEAARLPAAIGWQVGIDWSPQGDALAVSTGEGQVTIWDTSAWQPTRTFDAHEAAPIDEGLDPYARIGNMDWSPDGGRLATGGFDDVAVWDPLDGRELFRHAHGGGPSSVAFGPDGELAIIGGDQITILDPSGDVVAELGLDGAEYGEDLRFSPSGRYVAAALQTTQDGHVAIYDWRAGTKTAMIDRPAANVHWTQDGDRLLVTELNTASGDQPSATIWDVSTLDQETPDAAGSPQTLDPATDLLATLVGHTNWVQEAVWSPSEHEVATCSGDGSARLWDAATGRQLQVLVDHGLGGFCRLRFSPDGRHLAIGDGELGVTVLAVELDELVATARRRLTRSWTLDECRRHLDLDTCPRDGSGTPS